MSDTICRFPVPRSLRLTMVLALLGGATAALAQEGAPGTGQALTLAPAAPVSGTAGLSGASGQNPFLGGVPAGPATGETIRLTLADAIARGLKQNLGSLVGSEEMRIAEANRTIARSALLPNIGGRVTGSRQTINLEAFGFPAPETGPIVGPFSVFDARVAVAQAIFDPAAIARYSAGRAGVEAAQSGYQDARDTVALTVTMLYLQTATSLARIESAKSQEDAARALYQRAVDLKNAGTVPGIEVLRAQVQLQAQTQRVIFYQNEYAKQKLGLARAIGLPLGQEFEIADREPYTPMQGVDLPRVLERAYRGREDLKALEAQVRSAESIRRADIAEALPAVRASGDVGWIGPTWGHAQKTFTIGAGLVIPLFQGGRTRARVAEADAALVQLRARRDDLRNRVEYDVRSALLDLGSADQRVGVAKSAVDLAQEQVRQSQDRFSAGVASNLEVVQAQDALASATDNYLSAVFAHNLGKAELARALGAAERSMTAFLGGNQAE